MAVKRCVYCDAHIQWLYTTTGTRLPFDYDLTPVDELEPGQGWLVARIVKAGRPRAAVVPMAHCGAAKTAAARRALTVHSCRQYQALNQGTPPQIVQ